MRGMHLATLLTVVGLSHDSAYSANVDQAPTVRAVIAAWEDFDKQFFGFQSLFMVYSRPKSEDVEPSNFGGYFAAEWKLGYKADKWFFERRATEPVRTADLFLPAEPKTQVVNRNLILEWTQDNNRAILDRFGLGRNMYAGLEYTLNLSLDAPMHIARSNGIADRIGEIRKLGAYVADTDRPFLPAYLRESESQYQVLPEPDEVNGHRAWVLEWPGMDRLWVDSSRNFALLRRAYTWGSGKPLRVDVHNEDYREAKDGLWLPYSQKVELYASLADRQALWGKVVSRLEYRLKSIEFDRLSDDFFDVKLPTGTIVLDIPREMEYKVAGDETSEPFDAPIAEATRELGRSWHWWAAANAAILLLFGCIALYYWRRWKFSRAAA